MLEVMWPWHCFAKGRFTDWKLGASFLKCSPAEMRAYLKAEVHTRNYSCFCENINSRYFEDVCNFPRCDLQQLSSRSSPIRRTLLAALGWHKWALGSSSQFVIPWNSKDHISSIARRELTCEPKTRLLFFSLRLQLLWFKILRDHTTLSTKSTLLCTAVPRQPQRLHNRVVARTSEHHQADSSMFILHEMASALQTHTAPRRFFPESS